MFFLKNQKEIDELNESLEEQQRVMEALDRSMASIEFRLDGTIVRANGNFLQAMGYDAGELEGKHHRIFCENEYANGKDYEHFWHRLRNGEFFSGKIKRLKKGGEVIWLEATYNPIADTKGNIYKVIKFASDVTQATKDNAEQAEKMNAVDANMATIEFNLDGTIITANDNFLDAVGYDLREIRGKHHKIFCDDTYASGEEYRKFWRELGQGKTKSGQFKRVKKDGSTMWLEASYTPVYSPDGKLYKIVKFGSDISNSMFEREYFTQTLEQAIDAVVTIDPNNNVSLFNKAAENLWGYSRDEVIGKNVKMLVPQAIQSQHDSLVNANRTTGVNKIVGTSREVEIHRKDGDMLWGKLSLSRLKVNGETHYSAFVQDVTAEVRRRDEFRRLSLVANETDNSVVITDAQGKIQYVNPGFEKMTGYSPEEAQGRKPGDLLQGPDTDQQTVREIRQKLDAREPFYNEILNYHKTGEPYWISLAINPVFDENGELVNFISIQANVTETKLRALEFNYKLDAIGRANAVAEFELSGNLTAMNENYLKIFGVAEESQLIGTSLRNMIHKDSINDGEFNNLWETLNSGKFATGEFKHQTSSGDVRWINGSFNPIMDTSGNISKFVMFGEDVTSRKEAIANIADALSQLEQGNLTARVNGEFGQEFNLLRDSLNTSMEKLQESVKDILFVANGVTQGASEIARGNLDLSSRVESQAAALEETSSTMEEMTASAKNSAENAAQVNERALETGESANRGKDIVDNAVNSMSEISSASKRIADIISVIDEIAFQTNLLALNAAVEAARAGEQGRGFAVVAGEVRNLAQRSAQAAKEIGTLIKDSVDKVEEGTELVNTSGKMLEEITQKVLEVTEMVSEITEASKGQLEGIQQANAAVTSMDSMTQQNAALVEEATAASSEMSNSVEKMRRDLQFFKIG